MHDAAIIAIVVIIAVICALFNFLTLGIILANRNLRKRTSSLPTISFLLASAMQGIIPGPLYVYRKLEHEDHYPDWACDLYRFPYLLCGHLMQISVLLVSIDRMVAIRYPFRYEAANSKKKMLIALFVLWAIAIVVDIIPFIHGRIGGAREGCFYNPSRFWGLSVIVCFNILPFVWVVVNYLTIWCIAARFAADDRERAGTFCSQSSDVNRPLIKSDKKSSYGTTIQSGVNKTLSNLKFYLEIKATKMSLVLVGIYLLCWGPLAVFYTMDHFCSNCLSMEGRNSTVRTVIKLFNFSSSILVPLFYCWWNSDFQKTAASVFKKIYTALRCSCCRRNEYGSLSSKRLRQNGNGSIMTIETTRFD